MNAYVLKVSGHSCSLLRVKAALFSGWNGPAFLHHCTHHCRHTVLSSQLCMGLLVQEASAAVCRG